MFKFYVGANETATDSSLRKKIRKKRKEVIGTE